MISGHKFLQTVLHGKGDETCNHCSTNILLIQCLEVHDIMAVACSNNYIMIPVTVNIIVSNHFQTFVWKFCNDASMKTQS